MSEYGVFSKSRTEVCIAACLVVILIDQTQYERIDMPVRTLGGRMQGEAFRPLNVRDIKSYGKYIMGGFPGRKVERLKFLVFGGGRSGSTP